MKLDEFVTNVLIDINKGLQDGLDRTGRKYYVENSGNKGVSFDIAVTTINSTGHQAEGTAKAGIIEVLGAGVGAKLEGKKEKSEASRIQFSVFVPYETEQENARSRAELATRGPGGTDWSID